MPTAPKRSALGVFGWLVFAAVLFGGIGTLLYGALGERGDRVPASALVPATPGSAESMGSALQGVPQGSATVGSGSQVATAAIVEPAGSNAGSNAHTAPPPVVKPVIKPVPHHPVAPPEDRDPKALLKAAKAFEKSGDWEQARGVYQKLQKIKAYAPEALYDEAWAAFQSNDNDGAQTLAKAAITANGPRVIDAMFLYGDALYRANLFQRAKDMYMSLRRRLTGAPKMTAIKKIVACNKALHVAENDGVSD
jgi:hypothetical protein